MPKFRVYITWDVPQSGWVHVEADDDEEALELVNELIDDRKELEIVDDDGKAITDDGPGDDGYYADGDVEELEGE